MNISHHVRGSARAQAPDYGTSASPSDFAVGLIHLYASVILIR
jgi:hypothetical protein